MKDQTQIEKLAYGGCGVCGGGGGDGGDGGDEAKTKNTQPTWSFYSLKLYKAARYDLLVHGCKDNKGGEKIHIIL